MLYDINQVLQHHLKQLNQEISAYRNEANLWLLQGDISNTPGNLCLHLCGNLQHFIGAVLGNTGYVRNRDDEFNLKNVPRSKLLSEIDQTATTVEQTLTRLSSQILSATYPIEVFGKPMTTGYFLVHLATHLGYHLGQINYHRRLLDKG